MKHLRISCIVYGLLLTAGYMLLFPRDVSAIPLADYHKNIQRAITGLDTLVQMDEEESYDDYERRLVATIEGVRRSLPKNQPVHSQAEVFTVDNSWLHKDLDDIGKSPAGERSARIARVLEALKALEERVAEMQKPADVLTDKADVREKLAAILARPEYSTTAKGPNALTRLLRDFLRWIERYLPKRPQLEPGRASTISFIAQIAVVAVALGVLLYVLKLLLARLRGPRKEKRTKIREARIVLGVQLEPEESATDLLSEAEALALRGDLRAAIRKAYIALLVELGDRKLISLAQHKTNRDYLRAVSNIPLLHSRMIKLTDSFEQHWYGFAIATQNEWQDFRAGYKAALQTKN